MSKRSKRRAKINWKDVDPIIRAWIYAYTDAKIEAAKLTKHDSAVDIIRVGEELYAAEENLVRMLSMSARLLAELTKEKEKNAA